MGEGVQRGNLLSEETLYALSALPPDGRPFGLDNQGEGMDLCPKCGREFGYEVQRTKHHVYPRRFYRGSSLTIDICRACHDQLERRIPAKTRLYDEFYILVVNNFLGYKAI